jgi:hypothetical protein
MTSAVENFRHFKPSGPVSAAFVRDNTSMVKALLGPVGGGKTVANVYNCIRRPMIMPACNDGIVRYRCAIIGSTYGQLERNLYPTWWRWLPKDPKVWTEGEWQGGGGRFAIQRMEWETARKEADGEWRNRIIKAEYIFAAIGDLVVEEFMRGFEPTDFYLYEMDQLPEAVVTVGITRIGRYPAKGDAPDALRKDHGFLPQVAGDLNAPDVDSWFYAMFEERQPGMPDENGDPIQPMMVDGKEVVFKVYKQPSGLSRRAENIANLDAGYYDRQVAALLRQKGGKSLVKRMVHAQYAPTRIGEPVYDDEYSDDAHLAPRELPALRGLSLRLGFDQGLGMPAAVIAQKAPSGQWRVLDECVPGRMNARRFAAKVRQLITDRYPGVPFAELHYADPAGFTGADTEAGELAWAEIVAAELGIVIMPTETNEIDIRLTAVSDELGHMIDAGQPAFLLSPRCKMLRKGFVSHYMFEKRPDEKSQNKKPVKNKWSNPHDALQYLMLGDKGRFGAIEGHADASAPERAIGHKSGQRQTDDACVVVDAPVDFG